MGRGSCGAEINRLALSMLCVVFGCSCTELRMVCTRASDSGVPGEVPRREVHVVVVL